MYKKEQTYEPSSVKHSFLNRDVDERKGERNNMVFCFNCLIIYYF